MKSITEPGKSVVSNDLVKKMKAEDRGPGQTVPQSKRAQDKRHVAPRAWVSVWLGGGGRGQFLL